MNKEILKRKESFIITAIQTLDELGVQGLTTRELAKREGVSEPALYRQFNSKDDIILAVVEEFAKYDSNIINTILENDMSFMDGILYFAGTYSDYYQGYSQIASVMYSSDFYRNSKEANEKMKIVFEKRFNFIKSFIEKAEQKEEIKFEISSEELADIILGIIHSITYFWKTRDSSENLKGKISRSLEFVLKN